MSEDVIHVAIHSGLLGCLSFLNFSKHYAVLRFASNLHFELYQLTLTHPVLRQTVLRIVLRTNLLFGVLRIR